MTPMTLQRAIELAPAINTDHAYPYQSDNFVHINTRDLLVAMMDNGFSIADVQQAKGKINNRGIDTSLYNQHIVRMRETKSFDKTTVGDSIPEIVMLNSHNGAGCLVVTGGLFRLVCSNGMVVGESFQSAHIAHRWISPDEVVEQAREVWEKIPLLAEWQKRALQREMSHEEQGQFAAKAQVLRFPNRKEMPFSPDKLLETRRDQDKGNDLWHVFNRVQENSVVGGIEGQSANGRRTVSRGISGIAANTELNQGLWDLADTYLQAA